MKQLEDLPSVRETSSSSTVVDGGDVDNRGAGDRDRSRVNKKNNKQPLFASANNEDPQGEGDDADKSITEKIQDIRNREVDGVNEEENKEENLEEMKENAENQEKQWMAWNAAQQAKNKKPWWAVSDEYEAYTDYTPIFAKDGAFGPKYKSFKSFEDGGMNSPFKSVADKFRGRGSSGFGSGFKIPTLYESREDTTKAGEIYLEAKIIGLENEIDKFKQIMDVDSEEDKAKLAAMQTSLEETKEELFMLRGGHVTRTSINMENNNNTDDNLLEE